MQETLWLNITTSSLYSPTLLLFSNAFTHFTFNIGAISREEPFQWHFPNHLIPLKDSFFTKSQPSCGESSKVIEGISALNSTRFFHPPRSLISPYLGEKTLRTCPFTTASLVKSFEFSSNGHDDHLELKQRCERIQKTIFSIRNQDFTLDLAP